MVAVQALWKSQLETEGVPHALSSRRSECVLKPGLEPISLTGLGITRSEQPMEAWILNEGSEI